jgi:hypothetical protein
MRSIPTLMDVLEHSTNNLVRYNTVRASGDLGTAALPAKAILLKTGRDETQNWPNTSISTSDMALRALAEMPLSVEELMPLFTEQLMATNAAAGAAYGLARLGSIGAPVLVSSLTNEDSKIHLAAKTGLEFQQYLQTNSTDTFFLFERFHVRFNQNVLRARWAHPVD